MLPYLHSLTPKTMDYIDNGASQPHWKRIVLFAKITEGDEILRVFHLPHTSLTPSEEVVAHRRSLKPITKEP